MSSSSDSRAQEPVWVLDRRGERRCHYLGPPRPHMFKLGVCRSFVAAGTLGVSACMAQPDLKPRPLSKIASNCPVLVAWPKLLGVVNVGLRLEVSSSRRGCCKHHLPRMGACQNGPHDPETFCWLPGHSGRSGHSEWL